jgi:hypothetical protein
MFRKATLGFVAGGALPLATSTEAAISGGVLATRRTDRCVHSLL